MLHLRSFGSLFGKGAINGNLQITVRKGFEDISIRGTFLSPGNRCLITTGSNKNDGNM